MDGIGTLHRLVAFVKSSAKLYLASLLSTCTMGTAGTCVEMDWRLYRECGQH